MFEKSIIDSLRGLTVLVAEDNGHMRNLLRTLLEAMGLDRVVLAPDGATALIEYDLLRPDILITDGAMKPMDGFQLIRELRKREAPDETPIPIIMLSGYLEVSRVKLAKELGVTSFLAKPVSGRALYQHIRHAIEARPSVASDETSSDDPALVNQWSVG